MRLLSLRTGAMVLALAPALFVTSQVPSSTSTHATESSVASRTAPQYRNLDCNSPYSAIRQLKPTYGELCADPIRVTAGGYSRFTEHGYYVGHDEPQVRFISDAPGSGNSMTYFMRLPVDPARRLTPAGTVTDSAELSVPWFGLVLCDPLSYPQRPCTPDSDRNLGGHQPTAAGSALLELQFYPPGFTPFLGSLSCSTKWWCAALNIFSLECTFNMMHCNPNCTEIANFAFVQTNGVPTGPPGPEAISFSTLIPNAHTLRMHPGDVLRVSITDPRRGLTIRVTDLTTRQAGYMVASAAGLGRAAQTCVGGVEGKGRVGPGPCTRLVLGRCKNPETEGLHGPVACPTRRASLKTLCEFTGFPCAPKGTAHFTVNGHKISQVTPVAYCAPADLDFDSEDYLARSWPGRTAAHPPR